MPFLRRRLARPSAVSAATRPIGRLGMERWRVSCNRSMRQETMRKLCTLQEAPALPGRRPRG
eukprot:4969599-Lingulodinium_polyedra.AAC.1